MQDMTERALTTCLMTACLISISPVLARAASPRTLQNIVLWGFLSIFQSETDSSVNFSHLWLVCKVCLFSLCSVVCLLFV
jgi:hypothetical protein